MSSTKFDKDDSSPWASPVTCIEMISLCQEKMEIWHRNDDPSEKKKKKKKNLYSSWYSYVYLPVRSILHISGQAIALCFLLGECPWKLCQPKSFTRRTTVGRNTWRRRLEQAHARCTLFVVSWQNGLSWLCRKLRKIRHQFYYRFKCPSGWETLATDLCWRPYCELRATIVLWLQSIGPSKLWLIGYVNQVPRIGRSLGP